MVAILGYSRDQILAAVKAMYSEVADAPDSPFHFPVGREACRLVGYPDDALDALPEAAVASFAGVGYPFRAGAIRPGDTVLDIGSGSGTDALLAAKLTGSSGKVWAVDMTPAMIAKLRDTIAREDVRNVEVIEGSAEKVPLPDNSVDVVTSNGVLNLVPDKRAAIAEIFRVLKPGGRVQIADIVIGRPVTADCRNDPKLWAECVVGATVDDDYLQMFRDAGFTDVAVLREFDYFAKSPSPETRKVAGGLSARSIEIAMTRGAKAPARIVQLARRADPRRLVKAVERRGLSGLVALGLALAACYGAVAALGLLAVLGVTLTLHEGVWAGAITLFAGLAAAAVAAGYRRHGSATPLGLALAGFAAIAYAMFVSYSGAVELGGFVLLAAAVAWDYALRRRLERALPA